jgi:ribonuclease P protein component
MFYCHYSEPKLGIKISKKAVPLAVSRNSLRRRLRENFRSNEFKSGAYAILLSISNKIQAEKKDINDILLREWTSLLDQLN